MLINLIVYTDTRPIYLFILFKYMIHTIVWIKALAPEDCLYLCKVMCNIIEYMQNIQEI